ncbi:MAG: FAD-binding protein, partial [Eggerthellaceae bacterium]|nr:FAD-binding protein [Eggerthellaceae bacterium]
MRSIENGYKGFLVNHTTNPCFTQHYRPPYTCVAGFPERKDRNMKNEVSRRSFLEGAIAGLAGAACLGGMAACSKKDQEPEAEVIPLGLPEKWDIEADIVVCGLGAAGIGAARGAIGAGASCVILEKAPEQYAGGATSVAGGFFVPKTTPEALIEDSNNYLSREAAKTMCDSMAESVDWCIGSGLKVNKVTFGVMEIYLSNGFGAGFYQFLSESIKDCGANILYETAVTKLVYDATNKRVCGVEAVDASGKTLFFKANKGVILATGNMCGNRDLVDRYFVPNGLETAHCGSPYNTGDGFIMASELGASPKSLNVRGLELCSWSFTKGSDEIGTALQFSPNGAHKDAYIMVSKKGKRIMNENSTWGHYKGIAPWYDFQTTSSYHNPLDLGWTNWPVYVVFDSKMASEPVSTNTGSGWAFMKGVYNWSADNSAEMAKGWIAKGDTIEELVANLAKQSGKDQIDPEALKATIAQYNGYCADGVDLAFERQGLMALDTPPYYAAQLSLGLLYTVGGLRSGKNAETLDWHDNPIAGLYHAGDIGQTHELNSQGIIGALG